MREPRPGKNGASALQGSVKEKNRAKTQEGSRKERPGRRWEYCGNYCQLILTAVIEAQEEGKHDNIRAPAAATVKSFSSRGGI
jgi:hypothetical protein